ncbi:MAG TPA: ABC transporter ATP-binding protein [Syntrophomonadaceae bacterium]|nr:ABC transporter ATP-binding protein [Syntrophomonadaceae bacterium]
MAEEILMHLEQVSKQYPMGDVVVDALMEAALEIYSGELLVIAGPSGSGKSTMLNLLGGMDQPTSGRLFFGDQELSSASEQQLTQYRRLQVGFVFQFYNLIPDLTAEENIALAAQLVSDPLPVEDALQQVGLLERAHHFPAQLSGGEQQRIAIARAVVKKPRLLLCDEPTGALDYQTGKSILGLLEKVNREMKSTVIIVTHNTAITNMAQRVVRMRSGRIAEIFRNEEPWPPERIEW